MTTNSRSPLNPDHAVFLVVDDDGQVREILTQYLRSFGYMNILQAKNGRVALKIIQNRKQQIDIIISDWEMPHVNGLTLLQAVRNHPHRADVRFLMVTSQASQERMKITRAARANVDAYIIKPFRAHVLKDKVNKLMGLESETASGRLPEEGPLDFYDLSKMTIDETVELMRSYLRVGWLDKGLRLGDEALERFGQNLELLFCLGQTYFLMSEYDQASAYLKRVLEADPNHETAKSLFEEISDQAA